MHLNQQAKHGAVCLELLSDSGHVSVIDTGIPNLAP